MLYFGIGVDGRIHCLGECTDFDAADEASSNLSVDCTWIFDEDDARGYVETINYHLKEKADDST